MISPDTAAHSSKIAHLLWSPSGHSLDKDSAALSFLSPIREYELTRDHPGIETVSMACVMDEVKEEAYDLYLEIVADIGKFSSGGRSLRSRLHGKGKVSRWWYHPVAFRNSESEPTYTNLLAVLAILKVAKERGIGTLHLHHPPEGMAETLCSRFRVTVHGGSRRRSWSTLLRKVLGRVRYCLRVVEEKRVCDRAQGEGDIAPFEVALQGFWDWSVFADSERPGELKDRYFGALPRELAASGKSVGYWCWYDPWTGAQGEKRNHGEVVASLQGRRDVLLLQSQLGYGDILRAFFDFKAFLALFSVVGKAPFRSIFDAGGINFFPLFKPSLLDGALGMAIVQCQLFERATARANAATDSRLLVTFLEHFPQSRAMYAGLQGSGSRAWSVQHGCYNWGKTYGALHPAKEFATQSDGESVPHPDRICVMGELGAAIFGRCGYGREQVLETGSCRYDHVRVDAAAPAGQGGAGPFRVLVATSLPARADFALVEAAVAAVRPLEGRVALRLRCHPFGRMDALPGFGAVAGHLELSTGSLPEDMAWADLVLISQSIVGEEAVLTGKEVWQLRFPHPDQSSLAEVASIPRFYSVGTLQEALQQRLSSGQRREMPAPEQVYRSLFQIHDGLPSKVIAERILLEFH